MSDTAEDMSGITRGAMRWEASTRNRWVLKISGIHVASVERSRSWKSLNQWRPWYVEIFGNRFPPGLSGDKNWFRTLDLGRAAAERELRDELQVITKGLRR